MADRSFVDENMAVSSDIHATQNNLRDNGKEELDIRFLGNNSKTEAPKRKTTFKITSVTKSTRVVSGELTQDNDGDSIDDLDETVDSHTDDLSSEIYDTNSKATDIDNQDPLMTPEEVIKEKPGRFKVVKVETKEPFRRGRWVCYDYLDCPEKTDNRQELEINVHSGGSSTANSLHYVHGVDDPSKNPLLAGATGTVPLQHPSSLSVDGVMAKGIGEAFQPIQPAPPSQPVINPQHIVPSQPNWQSETNHLYVNQLDQTIPVAISLGTSVPFPGQPLPYAVQAAMPGRSLGPALTAGSVPNVASRGSTVNLSTSNVAMPRGQTMTSQCLQGTISYPNAQQLSTPVSLAHTSINGNPPLSSIPASLQSMSGLSTPISGVQRSDYVNSMPQGQVLAQPSSLSQPQQIQGFDPAIAQNVNAPSFNLVKPVNAGSMHPGMVPQQNHLGHLPATDVHLPDGKITDKSQHLQVSHSSSDLTGLQHRQEGIVLGTEDTKGMDDIGGVLGSGLAPLEQAVGGMMNAPQEEETTATEEAGSSTVAIDNKIEQAMDLVKSHLMYAVREEVEVLKEQIKELMERLSQLEFENNILKANATPETLAQLAAAQAQTQQPSSTSS